jgi:hypothetical protein
MWSRGRRASRLEQWSVSRIAGMAKHVDWKRSCACGDYLRSTYKNSLIVCWLITHSAVWHRGTGGIEWIKDQTGPLLQRQRERSTNFYRWDSRFTSSWMRSYECGVAIFAGWCHVSDPTVRFSHIFYVDNSVHSLLRLFTVLQLVTTIRCDGHMYAHVGPSG